MCEFWNTRHATHFCHAGSARYIEGRLTAGRFGRLEATSKDRFFPSTVLPSGSHVSPSGDHTHTYLCERLAGGQAGRRAGGQGQRGRTLASVSNVVGHVGMSVRPVI